MPAHIKILHSLLLGLVLLLVGCGGNQPRASPPEAGLAGGATAHEWEGPIARAGQTYYAGDES